MQISTKPQAARKIIDASLPKNISDIDKKKLEQDWIDQANKRNEAIALETTIPLEPSVILKYELHKFGRHWVGYAREGKKLVPLMNAPSLLTSAMDAISDRMSEEALRV